jgi:hypothetical protein
MTDYKPGTVAKATVRGVPDIRVVRGPNGWFDLSEGRIPSLHSDGPDVTDVRPLVVLDLDESEGGGRLLPRWLRNNVSEVERASISPTPIGKDMRWLADQIEAQTKPSRIPEPGLWGVVRAARREVDGSATTAHGIWIRTKHVTCPWTHDSGNRTANWNDLIDPVLIREGVES